MARPDADRCVTCSAVEYLGFIQPKFRARADECAGPSPMQERGDEKLVLASVCVIAAFVALSLAPLWGSDKLEGLRQTR